LVQRREVIRGKGVKKVTKENRGVFPGGNDGKENPVSYERKNSRNPEKKKKKTGW